MSVNVNPGALAAAAHLEIGAAASVKVPASTANLGPGFDSIGMALGVWDEASASLTGEALVITHEGLGADDVPLDENHLVYVAMTTAWQVLNLETPRGIELHYRGGIPHARGMGSSASAIVAGVGLALALAGLDLDEDDVLALASDISSSMEGHPDNASASVYGGVTLSWADDGVSTGWRTARVSPHPSIDPVVLVPAEKLSTHTARAALANEVSLADAARNSGRSALLVHALTQAPHLLMPATVDYLHQEARRPAYPASMQLVDELRAAGVPATISGAGPTVLAFATAQTKDVVARIAAGREMLSPGVPTRGLTRITS